MAIHGVIRAFHRKHSSSSDPCPRPHIITTVIEHNAVLRTLHCYASSKQIQLDVIRCDAFGQVQIQDIVACMRPDTLMLALSHSSNVLGTIQPVREIVQAVRKCCPEVLILLDAAQTIGHIPIDVQDLDVDLLSIAGHKALKGPTGTGALYISSRAFPETEEEARIFCERRGGTGAVAPGLEMPNVLPDALEAGTPNAVGFAGLLAAIEEFEGEVCERAHAHEMRLTQQIIDGLNAQDHVTVYGLPDTRGRTPVVLFNISDLHPRKVASILDERFGIATRGGVHCAPLMHESIGTGPGGGVRISPGVYTTEDEIKTFLDAVATVVAERCHYIMAQST
jgi:selenocysteine lyase/cysteine desulfurase